MSESRGLILSAPQAIFLSDLDAKYRAYVGGFGSGKTFVGCLDLGIFAGRHPGYTQGYFGPTYPSIRDIFYPTMDEAASMLGLRIEVRFADKEVHIYRGRAFYGTVICRSMERPQAIVGFKIARALVDEIDTMPKDKAKAAWIKITARLRQVVPGVENGIGVTTTPEGFRFVYDRFAVNPTGSYAMVQASTHENAAHLPDDYISTLEETYTPELIQAYLNGEFVNLTSGSVYRAFDRQRNGSAEKIESKEALYIGMDFNIGNMAAAIKVKRDNGMHTVAEIVDGVDTPSMIETLKAKYPENKKTIYPDASGKNASSKGADLSDIGLLTQAGFTIKAKPANPPVKSRVLAVNKGFSDMTEWVNAATAPTIAAHLEQQAYDKNGEPDKKSGTDHTNDAFGYETVYERPVVRPVHNLTELRL